MCCGWERRMLDDEGRYQRLGTNTGALKDAEVRPPAGSRRAPWTWRREPAETAAGCGAADYATRTAHGRSGGGAPSVWAAAAPRPTARAGGGGRWKQRRCRTHPVVSVNVFRAAADTVARKPTCGGAAADRLWPIGGASATGLQRPVRGERWSWWLRGQDKASSTHDLRAIGVCASRWLLAPNAQKHES